MARTCIVGDPRTYPGEMRVIRTPGLTATFVGGHKQYLIWSRRGGLLGEIGSAKAFFRCPDKHKREFDLIMDRVMDDHTAAMARLEDEED